MNKVMLFIMIIISSIFAQDYEDTQNEAKWHFEGEHPLKALRYNVTTTGKQESSSSGVFVLGFGGFSSDGSASTEIKYIYKFMWRDAWGAYINTTLTDDKVRFIFDESATVPKVTFKWTDDYCPNSFDFCGDMQSDRRIIYATIRIKESQVMVLLKNESK